MSEIIMGIPLMFEKVKPNWVYGFRTPKTVNNKDIWYKSNKYLGRDFVVAGIVVISSSFLLFVFDSGFTITEIVLIETVLLVGTILFVLVRGFSYLKSILND